MVGALEQIKSAIEGNKEINSLERTAAILLTPVINHLKLAAEKRDVSEKKDAELKALGANPPADLASKQTPEAQAAG
jgi:hypothetical protein